MFAVMEEQMRMTLLGVAMVLMAAGAPRGVAAAEIKVLTAGAFKQVLLVLVPEFEKQTGHKVILENDTVGALTKRIEGGEAFDLAVLTPAAVNDLSAKGKFVAGSRTNLGRVGVGVVVKEGAPKPDISSVDAFKRALLAAKSVAYIDPAAGGSSGIYVSGLLDKLGIADRGQAEGQADPGRRGRGAHRSAARRSSAFIRSARSLPVKGITLVGPLPADIQNYTVYAAGLGANAKESEAAKALIKALLGSGRGRRAQVQGHGAGRLVTALAGSRHAASKALFFDVFGTLVDWRTSIAREAERILKPRGSRARLARLRRRLARRISTRRWRRCVPAASRSASSTCCTGAISNASCRASTSRAFRGRRCAQSQSRLASARCLARCSARHGAAQATLLLAPVSNGNISLMVDLARRNTFPGTRSWAPRPRATTSPSRASISPPARPSICRPAIA